MKVLGIVAEFNPFHNGHKYLIENAKKITKADTTIVVMSGNFTQSGNIAIYNKFDRAKMAINNGADIIIELPSIFSISSAEYFCQKSVEILNSLGVVDYIAFGAESNIEILNNISNKIIQNEKSIWENISIHLKSGMSFASARYEALKNVLNDEELKFSSKSNNILGINYINTLKKLESNIVPIAIKRVGAYYNQENILSEDFSSATSIRNYLQNNKNINILNSKVPQDVFKYIKDNPITKNEDLFYILKYKILELGPTNLKKINEITEGLENKIYSSINISSSYEELLYNIKSKRYQMSKIKRILINILLNITKENFDIIKKENLYAHILALSSIGKTCLSKLNKNSNIPIIMKKSDFENIENSTLKTCLNYDILASNIYSIINNKPINIDFSNKI